jgi:hypothetical protein
LLTPNYRPLEVQIEFSEEYAARAPIDVQAIKVFDMSGPSESDMALLLARGPAVAAVEEFELASS